MESLKTLNLQHDFKQHVGVPFFFYLLLFQDTCVALQSLSEYAILSYVGGVNLTISLASTNLDFQETFDLNKDNQKILQSAKVQASVL